MSSLEMTTPALRNDESYQLFLIALQPRTTLFPSSNDDRRDHTQSPEPGVVAAVLTAVRLQERPLREPLRSGVPGNDLHKRPTSTVEMGNLMHHVFVNETFCGQQVLWGFLRIKIGG
jgi:hypothetical protein